MALPAGWDSYGADPIDSRAIETSTRFLRSLESRYGDIFGERLKPSIAAPLPSGGVQLEWDGERGRLEIEIWSAGEINLLVVDRERTCVSTVDVTIADAMKAVARILMA